MGHIKMMAAVQPFLSGAISKTVNMPTDATPDEIANAYVGVLAAGPQGGGGLPRRLQAQPAALHVEGREGDGDAGDGRRGPRGPPGRKLPDERHAITHKFSIAGHEGYITVGMYEDGKPGEIFLVMAKEGSTISGLMDAFATSISMALQYGVPLEALVEKFSHVRFEPSGFTKNSRDPLRQEHHRLHLPVAGLASSCPPSSQEAVGVQAERPHRGRRAAHGAGDPRPAPPSGTQRGRQRHDLPQPGRRAVRATTAAAS